jgi:hypothetical protein
MNRASSFGDPERLDETVLDGLRIPRRGCAGRARRAKLA